MAPLAAIDVLATHKVQASTVLLNDIKYMVRAPLLAALFALYVVGPLWQRAFAAWPWAERQREFFVVVSFVVHEGVYFLCNGFFTLCDRQGWLARYKLPRKAAQQPSAQLVSRTLKEMVVNHFMVQWLNLYYVAWLLFRWSGMPDMDAPLPSLGRAYFELLVCMQINSHGFYWAHRLLHWPPLYKRFHKQHHEYSGTIGIAAEYAHPVEQIFANIIPTIGGMVILGGHPVIWMTWLMWRLETTYEDHSGYYFEGSFLDRIGLLNAETAAHHDFHHTVNKGNYGSEFQDYFFGTMEPYLQYLAKCREASEAGKANKTIADANGDANGDANANGNGKAE